MDYDNYMRTLEFLGILLGLKEYTGEDEKKGDDQDGQRMQDMRA